MQLRRQPQKQLLEWLSSPWALRFSALCLTLVLVGLALEVVLS